MDPMTSKDVTANTLLFFPVNNSSNIFSWKVKQYPEIRSNQQLVKIKVKLDAYFLS